MTKAGCRRALLVAVMAMTVSLWLAPGARAHVELQATLDTAHEVPPPVNTLPNAGGTATFTFDDETKMLTYTVTLHDLTGPPQAAHIHEGPPGVAGPIRIDLDPAATSGTVGPLTDAQVTALFAGLLYINFHTAENLSGEVRGQIELVPGACGCSAFPNHGQFVKCVRKAVKKLEKSERKEDLIKAVKKASAKSSCGKKNGPKKAVACCLPRNPENNIVTDALCVAVKENKCSGIGGTSKGSSSSCFPTNPCSPSGAFLEEVLF
jgi:hypothetical protein